MALLPLSRSLHEKPWGRCDIPPELEGEGRHLGEARFDHPAGPLPLLVKWLFTSERLSIQVHPDDALARACGLPSGKGEWWLVTEAMPGATLGIGTSRKLTLAELDAAARDGSLEGLMDWKPVSAGDWFHIPPGTVHAIGAGITLVEVQQNADVTYRLFDYGRDRELHLEQGVPASNPAPYADSRQGRIADQNGALSSCRHFSIRHGMGSPLPGVQPAWIIPLSGVLCSGGASFRRGDVLYGEPDGQETVSCDFRFLHVTVPDDQPQTGQPARR